MRIELSRITGLFKNSTPVKDKLVKQFYARVGHVPKPFEPWGGLLIKDPEYGLRGDPTHPEHDAIGFRNRDVPKSASVVCIGDSNVYGAQVRPEQAWPAVLDQLLDMNVYSASLGGWGFFQYALAAEEMSILRPSQIVIGLSIANDFVETVSYTKHSTAPLAKTFWEPEYEGIPPVDLSQHIAARKWIEECQQKGMSLDQALAIGCKQRRVGFNCAVIEEATYYTEEFRRFPLQDMGHPEVQVGMELMKKQVLYIRNLARRSGIQLRCMLIPTREYLLYKRLSDAKVIHSAMIEQLGENEENLLAFIRDFLSENFIPCIDPCPLLANNLGQGIYHQFTDDGHLAPHGCYLVARLVQEHLQFEQRNPSSPDIYPLY